MNSISLPRGIGAERSMANALRAAASLASLGVLGYLIFGSPRPGSSAIAVLVLFAFALFLATAIVFFWKSMGLSKLILWDVLIALKLALALTTTTMVFLRSAPQGMVYGSLLLILFMLSVALRSHADRREERAAQSAPKAAVAVEAKADQKLEAEPTVASESDPADKVELSAGSADSDLRVRLESALPLLKRNS